MGVRLRILQASFEDLLVMALWVPLVSFALNVVNLATTWIGGMSSKSLIFVALSRRKWNGKARARDVVGEADRSGNDNTLSTLFQV